MRHTVNLNIKTYVNQSTATNNWTSANGIPMTCNTMLWTITGPAAGIGGAASMAIDDDMLKKLKII